MKIKNKNLFLFLLVMLLFPLLSSMVESSLTPKQILKNALTKWNKIKDYYCKFVYIEWKGSKKEEGDYIFYYKRPNLRRMEVLSGENKNTIVVYHPGVNKEKVKVKKGIFPFTLSASDERLEGFFGADWGSDLNHLKSYLKGGKMKLLKTESIGKRKAYVIQFTGKMSEYSKELVWFDTTSFLPLQIERYKDNRLHSRRTFTDFVINSGLKDDDFKF